jgi:hypothetical protein
MKAIKVSTDGVFEVVEFDNSNCYEMLKEGVGGWIECVRLPATGIEMWVNEEGKLNGLEQNSYGTALWSDSYGLTDVTVGNIVITGGTDDEGETLGLDDETIVYLLDYKKRIFIPNLDIEDYIGFTVTSM